MFCARKEMKAEKVEMAYCIRAIMVTLFTWALAYLSSFGGFRSIDMHVSLVTSCRCELLVTSRV